MDKPQGPIVGIDLGTTNSVVAIVENGQPRVLVEDGESLLPSVVGIDPKGKLITGVAARNQLAAFPERTVASIKRKMGTMERVSLADQSFTPPEISAMILRRLKDRAERALGAPVNRAVITVPAFFDDNQRQATREAAALAGFTAERIINEPTAATLVYHAGETGPKRIAVYDFGGGTFDISIVRMESGVIEVLSSSGDVHLGGDDLDMALMDSLAARFRAKTGVDLRERPHSKFRLLQACERAKCKLSTDETVQIAEEFIAEKDGQPLHFEATVTREEFEELITPFIDRTIQCVDKALRESNSTVPQIDDLVLVGGSTRIPLVEERLRQEFQREPSRAVDPDLAVALGAAVQAAMIGGESVGPVLVDVTGHTLGIEVLDEMTEDGPETSFSPIIRRNTALPARYEQAYLAVDPNQPAVDIHVLQGESEEVYRNQSIGKLRLDLQDSVKDRRKVVVRFDLTLDGTLKVLATQSATGASKEMVIQNALSQFQADERGKAKIRLESMFGTSFELLSPKELASMKHSTTGESETLATQDGALTFPEASDLLKKAGKIKASLQGSDAADMEDLCRDLKAAMEEGDRDSVSAISAQLDDLLFYVK